MRGLYSVDMASDVLHDVIIIGAGPVGLSFAASLRGTRYRIVVVDKLDDATLADPPYDGREIALTADSIQTLRALGAWEYLGAEEAAPLHGARVFNSESLNTLDLGPPGAGGAPIGHLVSNHLLRRVTYQAAITNPRLSCLTRAHVVNLTCGRNGVRVVLNDGRVLAARLVVAADSRFSETRRAVGIAARIVDFGKTMLVCRMEHDRAHECIAWEWFGHHQTLALLPLRGRCSSVVLTLPQTQIAQLQRLPAENFERDMQSRFAHRLGALRLVSERFTYPLMGVYARRFVAERFAVIGDAAVGMHPVTAHGFNFGLSGQRKLAELLRQAERDGHDIADPTLLRRYEQAHRQATLPLYLATNAIVRLYTDNSPPARLARGALLQIASRMRPIGAALTQWLMHERTS
jgi:ubiquinone biosynthesis UbiH/UbiF/VisC/COQ6 family hydroxylase